MSFYKNLSDIAGDVLKEFSQGQIVVLKQQAGDSEPWENPTPNYSEIPVSGVAKGVPLELVDGVIEASDLLVTVPPILKPTLSDKVKLDGSTHQIIKIIAKPAIGEPVVYQLVVRK